MDFRDRRLEGCNFGLLYLLTDDKEALLGLDIEKVGRRELVVFDEPAIPALIGVRPADFCKAHVSRLMSP